MNFHIKQIGVTLLELMLVLAIATTLLIMGLGIYGMLESQANESKLAANVDQLFYAMAHYYQANCRQQVTYAGAVVSPGTLDPATGVSTSTSKVLTISTDLQTPGYLSQWQTQALSPIVDNTAPGQGYFVQFNPYTSSSINANACQGPFNYPTFNASCVTSPANTVTPINGTAPQGTPNVVVWLSQVAVKMNSSSATQLQKWKNDLNATCAMTSNTGTCEANGSACNPMLSTCIYLVWERPASFISNNTSDHWAAMSTVKEFNQQYTNDNMALQSNINSGSTQPNVNTVNYLCGE